MDIVEKIKAAQKAYYDGPEEIMSDAEYDSLLQELAKIDPTNTLLTQVGKDRNKSWVKKSHIIPMGSLDKVMTVEEFEKRFAKTDKNEIFCVEYKLDGASIELVYREGLFVQAVTRGDGKEGDDITANVRKMRNFHESIKSTGIVALRGEILLDTTTFKNKYTGFKNPRSAANGTMKRLDGIGAEDLTIIYYEAYGIDYKNREQLYNQLNGSMFPLIGYYTKSKIPYVREETSKRQGLSFDIDGLVIKRDEIPTVEAGRDNPTDQVAFKFPSIGATTFLRKVEWSINGGTITPVGIFDPVEIGGATITRASLYNPQFIKTLGLKLNQLVYVERRGDVIPKITSCFKTDKEEEIDQPIDCPECGTPIEGTDTRIYCPNERCKEKILHRLMKWCTVLNILELGPATIEILYDAFVIRKIAHLYVMDIWDITGLPTIGPVQAEKLIRAIHSKKEITLSQLFGGYDIPLIGEKTIEKLIEAGFSTLGALFSISEKELLEIDGIGKEKADKILEGFAKYEEEINELLLASGIKIMIPTRESQKLKGLSFCFTGELENMTRAQAEELVIKHGGTVKTGVSIKLSYLVTNTPNSGSGKNLKADELLVDKITEAQFLRLLS